MGGGGGGGGVCGGVPAFCARPFSSTHGPRGTVRRKRQQQQPQQQKQQQQHPSRESLQLLPSAQRSWTEQPTMWRAPLLQLFLAFTCCVRWCHSEGERPFPPPPNDQHHHHHCRKCIVPCSRFRVVFASYPPLVHLLLTKTAPAIPLGNLMWIVNLWFAAHRNCLSDDI